MLPNDCVTFCYRAYLVHHS